MTFMACRYAFKPRGRVAVRTLVAVAAGEELTLAYINLAQPRGQCGSALQQTAPVHTARLVVLSARGGVLPSSPSAMT